MALPLTCDSIRIIAAYYSYVATLKSVDYNVAMALILNNNNNNNIDPERMKG